MWDVADLVCPEDGREVKDIESLEKDHLSQGHDVFYFINPKKLTHVLWHINADRAARLYHELNAEHKVVNSGIHAWAGDKDRRRDLDVRFHIF